MPFQLNITNPILMYYTYVLKSEKDGRFYTGVTNDLRKRLLKHNKGIVKSTKYRIPKILRVTNKGMV
jgi:predicted GIY-YIG superfamily endonuclease